MMAYYFMRIMQRQLKKMSNLYAIEMDRLEEEKLMRIGLLESGG